jgi:serine/threonine protein kinase
MAKAYGGRWKVVGDIGAGGQGDVFRVTDATGELAGEWALKRLRSKGRIGRFRQEVEVLRRLRHDNIIKIVDARLAEDGSDEASFLVMPIAQHGDLDARLPIYTGHIDSIIEVSKQIAGALEHAHASNVIHRDVKPGNILFPEVGHKVWVSDFGLSLDLTAERNTTDGEVVGPRFFTAPELEEGGAVNVTPAVDIYSLGQLIFYMMTGGKRFSRENVLDPRHADIFAKGPRHELLRLLLSKMVAPPASRYGAMDIVIREMAQIENWEKTAASGLLDTRGLDATRKLQKRLAEETHRQTAFEETREQDIERIRHVGVSLSEWLFTQLEATRPQIAAGDLLIVRVEVNERPMQPPLQVDTGSNTLLEERAYVGMTVRPPNDLRRRTFSLRLAVCAEVQHTLPATHSNYLGVPGNPRIAVLPFFHEYSEHSPHMNSDAGYILGKPAKVGVPDPIPISSAPLHYPRLVSHSYVDGNMAIVRFNASDWPAAQEQILNMTRDVVSRMMEYIGQVDTALLRAQEERW